MYSTHERFLCFRSLIQIKSHAQKVLKRLEAGENVFSRLEENVPRLFMLVSQIHKTFGLEPVQSFFSDSSVQLALLKAPKLAKKNRKSTIPARRPATLSKKMVELEENQNGAEHFLAASALCQLALPGDGKI